MCFVFIAFQVNAQYPLVVAANREESRSRPSTVPLRWPETPPLCAGRDEVAGGTWLGVNEVGLLAGITNRRSESVDASAPSRGLLCLGTLRQPSPRAALGFVTQELAARRYNPFNLLCSNTTEGWVGTWQGDFYPLTPGIHVVTNRGDLDNPADPRIRRALDAAPRLGLEKARLQTILTDLGRLCADTTGPEPICRVGGERGTVSSSLIALQADGTLAAYWHANGPPTEWPYVAVAIPSPLEGVG